MRDGTVDQPPSARRGSVERGGAACLVVCHRTVRVGTVGDDSNQQVRPAQKAYARSASGVGWCAQVQR